VTVVTDQDVSENRLRQGWIRPDFSPASLLVAPSEAQKRDLLKGERSGVHIFSGFHAYSGIYDVFGQAISMGLSVGIFAEPGRTGDFKSFFRRFRYRVHAFRWNRHIKFLLATGELGVRYYSRCGFPAEKLFPFAYFVEQAGPEESIFDGSSSAEQAKRKVSLLFVGVLNHNKGLDVLLSALACIQGQEWVLSIVGQGPDQAYLQETAKRLNIAYQLRWMGTLPNEKVRSLMQGMDCLLLPSRYDGWGAVVNEALLAGTPVIVSDACGSSDLVRAPWLGDVFSAGSIDSLSHVLGRRLAMGTLSPMVRARIRSWAQGAISPTAGAEYLLDIIRFVQRGHAADRPIAPWRKNLEQTSV